MRRTLGLVAATVLVGLVVVAVLFANLVAVCQMMGGGPNRWAPTPLFIMEGMVILFVLALWGLVFNDD